MHYLYNDVLWMFEIYSNINWAPVPAIDEDTIRFHLSAASVK